ncbi:hypothetical protein M9H77_06955 [Catharanthus roseus]|uniref:Uncharacterized protein n=1 Tax=Catharanthus roseus TaxID=4058 RepID=A0ACC0BTP6_CATRO|nr:hypothetical protein M9H77_06955 [Catharanthus roseus]
MLLSLVVIPLFLKQVNPREHVNAIFVTINEEIPTTKKEGMIMVEGSYKGRRKLTNANYKPKIPFQDTLFIKIFGQLKIKLPLCDLLFQVPKNGRQIASKLKASSMKWMPLRLLEEEKQTKHSDFQRLSLAAWKWVADRESLKIVIEKLFDESFIKHFKLQCLFGELGWLPFLLISGKFYQDLVRKFYANMLHKMDKDLEIIISTGVRIILTRECLASILGTPDEGTSVTVDSNKKTIDENLGWSYNAACDRFWPHLMDRCISSTVAISPLFFLVPLLIFSGTLFFKREAGKVMFALLTSIFLISFTIAPPSLSLPCLYTLCVILGVTTPKPTCIVTL